MALAPTEGTVFYKLNRDLCPGGLRRAGFRLPALREVLDLQQFLLLSVSSLCSLCAVCQLCAVIMCLKQCEMPVLRQLHPSHDSLRALRWLQLHRNLILVFKHCILRSIKV